MKTIRLNNTARTAAEQPKDARHPYYAWKVFVDEDPETLEDIEDVTYILHPTFPTPVRTVSDPSTGFALETKGWGEFDIKARVRFKDGSVRTTKHRLDLGRRD